MWWLWAEGAVLWKTCGFEKRNALHEHLGRRECLDFGGEGDRTFSPPPFNERIKPVLAGDERLRLDKRERERRQGHTAALERVEDG